MQPNIPNMLALMQEYYAQFSLNNAASYLLGAGSPSVTPTNNSGSAFNAITKITRLFFHQDLKIWELMCSITCNFYENN